MTDVITCFQGDGAANDTSGRTAEDFHAAQVRRGQVRGHEEIVPQVGVRLQTLGGGARNHGDEYRETALGSVRL